MKFSFFCLTALAVSSGQVFAETSEDRMIITASRMQQSLGNISPSVSIIGAAEIEAKGYFLVSDYLKDVVGLSLVKEGGPGANSSIFLRGAASAQTLVMIDGVRLNDTSSPDNGFSNGTLAVNQIERIEIIRGPSSTSYGSAAMGGVINIITKRARIAKSTAELEAGSFSTLTAKLSSENRLDTFSYYLSLVGQQTEGFSAVDDSKENDGKESYSFAAGASAELSENTELELAYRLDTTKADIDDFAADDENHTYDKRSDLVSLKLSATSSDLWKPVLEISTLSLDRRVEDLANNTEESDSKSRYEGDRNTYSFTNETRLSELVILAGIEIQQESAKFTTNFESLNKKEFSTDALFLQSDYFVSDGLVVNFGLRQESFEDFGDQTTYNFGGVVKLNDEKTRVRFLASSGFKAPSLYQLYSGSYGNLDLDAEKSQSYQLSLDQNLTEALNVQLVYFEQKFEDLIEFVTTNPETFEAEYQNISSAKSKGIEAEIAYEWNDFLRSSFSYTQLDAKDEATGKQLARRAKEHYRANVYYTRSDYALSLSWLRRSVLPGNQFSPYTPDIAQLDGNLQWRLNDDMKLWLRSENLLGEARPSLAGYQRTPRSYYLGVRSIIH